MASTNMSLQIMYLYVYLFFGVADYKEENARKKTKYTNHASQSSKISGFLFINNFNFFFNWNFTT